MSTEISKIEKLGNFPYWVDMKRENGEIIAYK